MGNTDLHSQTPALWGKPRATLLPLGATYMAIAAALKGEVGCSGIDIRCDCHIQFETRNSGGLEIELRSHVGPYCGDSIRAQLSHFRTLSYRTVHLRTVFCFTSLYTSSNAASLELSVLLNPTYAGF